MGRSENQLDSLMFLSGRLNFKNELISYMKIAYVHSGPDISIYSGKIGIGIVEII